MANLPNYIVDQNRFQLAGPPKWFQRALWEFDPSLVIVPSRQGFYYRLAQRRKLNLPERLVNDVLKEQADTRMLAAYHLVPVTTIMATVNWSNPLLFQELQMRAPWRMGGANKFNAMLEAQDEKHRLATAARVDDMTTETAKESWRYYNKLIGTRSHIFDVNVPGKPKPSSMGNAAALSLGSKTAYKPTIHSAWGDTLRPGR